MTCSACVWCLSGDTCFLSSNRVIEGVPHWRCRGHFHLNVVAGLLPVEGSKCAFSWCLNPSVIEDMCSWSGFRYNSLGLPCIYICSELAPWIGAILHCACRLGPDFQLCICIWNPQICVLFFFCLWGLTGTPRGNPHKLQTDWPFLPTQGSYSGPSCCRRQCKPQSAAVKMSWFIALSQMKCVSPVKNLGCNHSLLSIPSGPCRLPPSKTFNHSHSLTKYSSTCSRKNKPDSFINKCNENMFSAFVLFLFFGFSPLHSNFFRQGVYYPGRQL